MPRWTRRAVIVSAAGLAGLLAWRVLFVPDPVPVTVHETARGRVEATVTNSKAGTVMTRRRASLSTEMGGRVAEIRVREGDLVKEGDVLLRLGSTDLEAQVDVQSRALETAQAQAREACAAAEQSRRDHERTRELFDAQIVAQDRLEQARLLSVSATASCEAARAAARQASAGIGLAEAMRSKSVLVAPFDGVVAEVRTETGEFVAPSAPGVFMQPVIDLIDPASLYVSAPLDEVDVGRVRPGLPVRVTLDPHPDVALEGRVARVAPYVEDEREQSRTFEIEVELAPLPAGVTLVPGTTADVEVILEGRDDVLRIPSYALLEGDRVLVVEDDRLVSRSVRTGLRNWEHVEIVSGLAEGERVVVSLDRAEVKEGARVVATEGRASDAGP